LTVGNASLANRSARAGSNDVTPLSLALIVSLEMLSARLALAMGESSVKDMYPARNWAPWTEE
jgi:hypothetical protein